MFLGLSGPDQRAHIALNQARRIKKSGARWRASKWGSGMENKKPVAVVVGAGPGNGAALARRFVESGYAAAILSRVIGPRLRPSKMN